MLPLQSLHGPQVFAKIFIAKDILFLFDPVFQFTAHVLEQLDAENQK